MSQSAPRGLPVNPGWYAVAVQAMVVLCRSGELCPSAMLAEHVGAHAVFVRRILAQLVRAGLVEAREGRVGGYHLARPPERILLGDIYRALQAEPTETIEVTERRPIIEPGVRHVLGNIYQQTEAYLVSRLDAHTLADVTATTSDAPSSDANWEACESNLEKDANDHIGH
jgi:Rrf2 family transcriptional regulator, repressor of oqxAB